MNEQVMIYEVKSEASSNAQILFSNDSKYFYWNETKFKYLEMIDQYNQAAIQLDYLTGKF